MGPAVHYCVVKQVVKYVQSLGVSLDAGEIVDSIRPNIDGNHENWRMQITNYLPVIHQKLIDKQDISVAVRNVCHFLVDNHSVTQLLSGKADPLINGWAEFVINKDKYVVVNKHYQSYSHWNAALDQSLAETVSMYAKHARKWNFIMTANAVDMIRRDVKVATEFVGSYVELALRG